MEEKKFSDQLENSRDFSNCYVTLAPRLERFASRLLGEFEEARDVVQEAFIKLHCQQQKGIQTDNISSWLYCVITNAVRDRLRKKQRFGRYLNSHSFKEPQVSDDHMFCLAEYARVSDALNTLSLRERLLIALYQEGLSYAEMALASKMRASSVGRTLARAIDKLSRLLGHGGKK